MATIVITAEVENLEAWEAGFRTHGELFRQMTISKPIGIGFGEGNTVCLVAEADDLDTYMRLLESEATAEAMAHDGVKRETVQVFVLDREFQP